MRQQPEGTDRADPAPAGFANDLFAIADQVAAGVGGPVIIEDAGFRVLAYSAYLGEADRGRTEAILGRRIPQEWLDHLQASNLLARLVTSREVVEVRDGPWQARRRLIVGVHEHGRHVGVIWATETDRRLDRDARRALLRAAELVAPALHRHAESLAAESDRRGRQLRAILDGRGSAAAVAELGFPLTGTTAVLAVGPDEPERTGQSSLLAHVELCLDSLHQRAAAAWFGRHVLVLARADEAGALRIGHEIVRLAGSGPLAGVRIGVSTARRGPSALPRLREEAVRALGAVRSAPDQQVVRFGDVEAELLVREVCATMAGRLQLAGIDRLRAYDEHRGSDLVTSLRTYLDAACSLRGAAKALGVHPTTMHYRLTRVGEVSGLDLHDPEVRLAAGLVLRLRPDEPGA
ncbi:PucR family transcriptional regulator [Rhizomonospora bruguierae]|uniref:PucR family transcriptional regulator n=1 Tax=Rhizomonospora bruguierae TaxID=1581705 RepID=UPI001BCCD7BB|nr:PucR family transcriptional regulator [Micromonospora sp. NBRC 107566]